MSDLTENALRILERRYLRRDALGKPVETPEEMFRRVAQNIASADALYGATPEEVHRVEDEFYTAMSHLEFLPNSPTLINAGRALQQLAACFVLPVDDSIQGIFEAIKQAAQIHKSGGGTGFSFSRLRPKGDMVATSHGVASGPVSFIRVFDSMTETISQGGVRRGANMAILRVDHPDILEFIGAKSDVVELCNFNISVAVTESFMHKVEKGEDFDLVNPRTGALVKKLNAREVFDLIVANAWESGEPGLVFLDRINRDNPTPEIGEIEATNPCGEQPLLPYEACNLGSINLDKMVKDGRVDFEKLRRMVRLGVHFLDNVVDVSRYPISEIKGLTQGNRKIGLGVMGFADMLIMLGIAYDSEEAISIGRKVMSFIAEEALTMSRELAKRRGPFPNFPKSVFAKRGEPPRRNSTLTTVAPTGTISIIAGCSGGIEPVYAICYARKAFKQEILLEVNSLFDKVAKERGFYSDRLMQKIAGIGSVRGMAEVPADVQRLFVTAYDIAPEWHVRMQAAFQSAIDNAVSKTINLPASATKDDVRKAFWLAYTLGCKGITIYRDKTRREQVLSVDPHSASPESRISNSGLRVDRSEIQNPKSKIQNETTPRLTRTRSKPRAADADKCPECGNRMEAELACRICKFCGYYRCG
jgi:ribonucleoside-diphosphate reductase alpha chain